MPCRRPPRARLRRRTGCPPAPARPPPPALRARIAQAHRPAPHRAKTVSRRQRDPNAGQEGGQRRGLRRQRRRRSSTTSSRCVQPPGRPPGLPTVPEESRSQWSAAPRRPGWGVCAWQDRASISADEHPVSKTFNFYHQIASRAYTVFQGLFSVFLNLS